MAKKISTETGEVARGRARRARCVAHRLAVETSPAAGSRLGPRPRPVAAAPRLELATMSATSSIVVTLPATRVVARAHLRAASRSPPRASSPPPVPRASPSPRAAAPPSSAVPVRPETRPRPRLRRDRVSPRAVPTAERRATAKTFPSRCIVPRRSLPRLGLPPTPASIHPVPPRRAGEGETEPSEPEPPAPEVKSDPFGFGTSTGEPDKIQPDSTPPRAVSGTRGHLFHLHPPHLPLRRFLLLHLRPEERHRGIRRSRGRSRRAPPTSSRDSRRRAYYTRRRVASPVVGTIHITRTDARIEAKTI